MALGTLALIALLNPVVQAPIELGRKFVAGEKLTYLTKASFTDEERFGSRQTFIPSDEDYMYRHTLAVQKVKADGIAELLYTRPTMKVTMGDTLERAATTTEEKLDWKLQMDVSPVNEVIKVLDLTPKKKDAPKGDGLLVARRLLPQGSNADQVAIGVLFAFVGEVQRLAFFVGGFDTSLDLSPRMPFEEVKVGDTWQRTVSATPQKLKGKGEKMEVQRLDYTYTYQGVMKSSEGKSIHRIQAKVKMDSDMADFARQLTGDSKAGSMVKTVPLKFDAVVNFDLDLKTMHLVKAIAESSGSFSIEIKGAKQPILEDRFRGRTVVKLESWTPPSSKPAVGAETKPAVKKPGKGG